MNDTYKLRLIGGALMVTVPQRIVRDLQLKPGDEVIFRRAGTSRVISVEPLKSSEKGKEK